MKTYINHVIEKELEDCTPEELIAALELAIYINRLHAYPHVERRSDPQHYHLIGDRRKNPFTLTPRLMIILTLCMVAVSVVSWTAASISPAALYVIPLFFFYCAAIMLVRAKVKLIRLEASPSPQNGAE